MVERAVGEVSLSREEALRLDTSPEVELEQLAEAARQLRSKGKGPASKEEKKGGRKGEREKKRKRGEEAEGVFSAEEEKRKEEEKEEGGEKRTREKKREKGEEEGEGKGNARSLDDTKLSWDPVLVRVKARVERGRIGIGCVKQDLSTFLDEAVRTSEDGETVFDLIVGPLGQCRRLMVRNAAPGGELSRLILRSIHVFRCDLVRPAEGEALPAPPDLTLKPVADWSRFYGMAAGSLAEKIRA